MRLTGVLKVPPPSCDCCVCFYLFNDGARMQVRFPCEGGHFLCHTCYMLLPDPKLCPICREPANPRYQHLLHLTSENTATLNELIGCLSSVRDRTALQDGQIADQRQNQRHTQAQHDRLLEVSTIQQAVLRGMQARLTVMEAHRGEVEELCDRVRELDAQVRALHHRLDVQNVNNYRERAPVEV